MLDKNGFKRKTYTEILAEMEQSAKEKYGENVNLSAKSPLGLFLKINAWFIGTLYQLAEKVYFSGFKDTAEGISLDHVGKYIAIKRKLAQKAVGTITISGSEGTFIDVGFLVGTTDDILFETTEVVTIDSTGSIDATIQAQDAGSNGNVPAGTIVEVINPQSGVSSVTNSSETTDGRDRETDSEFRERYDKSVSKGGSSTVESIQATLLQTKGVRDAKVDENDTLTTDANGIPAKSVAPFVYSGDDTDVALAIFTSKAGGIQSYGSIVKTITDSQGNTHDIGFTRATVVNIYLDVTLTTNSEFPTDGKDQIATRLIEYIDGLGLDEDVIHSKLVAICFKVDGVDDVTLTISTDGTNYSTSNVSITTDQVAETDSTKVVIA